MRAKKLENLYEEYVDIMFQSSPGETPEWKAFYRRLSASLRAAMKARGLTLKVSQGHFEASGFVENPETGKVAYFGIGDMRWRTMGNPLDSVLYRTAVSDKDFTGGYNQYCKLYELPERIATLVA